MATELSLISLKSSRRKNPTAGLLSARPAVVRSDSSWVSGVCGPRSSGRGLHGSTRLGQAASRKPSAW